MSHLTVFVCGVTGTQGGSVARHLLKHGARVHALARDPSSAKAKAVQVLGVKLVPGDYNDTEALKTAMEGCNALFLNLSPDFADPTAEMRWAKSIMSIAKAAGVEHIVHSTGLSVNKPEKLSAWDPNSFVGTTLLSKQAVENETRNAGIKNWTILRPGAFMANYMSPSVFMYGDFVKTGRWTIATRKDTLLPLVDTDTIGRFGCAAFLDPARFNAQEIEYADEMLVPDQVMEKLSAVTGRDLRAVYLTDKEIEEKKASNIFITAQVMSRELSKFVDLDQVKTWGLPLSTFDAFIEKNKDLILQTYNQIS